MGLEFPRVTQCCFCLPLRTGSLMIGYFSIFEHGTFVMELFGGSLCPAVDFCKLLMSIEIVSCMTLAAISFYTYKVAAYVDSNKDHPNPNHPTDEVSKMALGLYLSFAYYMLVFLYNLVIHVVLVIGVHKNKPQYLKFYCNTAYFLFALAVALIVVTCVFMGFIATIPTLKWAFTLAIFIIVVRSTYLEMEEKMKPRNFEMQNLYIPQRAPLV